MEVPVQPEAEMTTASSENTLNKRFTITTFAITPNSAIQASPRGEISVEGGGNSIVINGFCYSNSPGATLSDDTVHAVPYYIANQFSGVITGLTAGTNYYVKAFGIKNNGDVYYGNEVSFTTLTIGFPGPGIGTVTDIDGNIYNTITLGAQVWMVENLKTTKFRDGTVIPNITDNTSWVNATSGAYCDYDNNPTNSAEYGGLYNLYAVKDNHGLAPAGWHVPNLTEWTTLILYLGGAGVAQGRMKEEGFTHWDSPNTGADNSSGLTALGSGNRSSSAQYYNLKKRAIFWSSTSSISSTSMNIYAIILEHDNNRWIEQRGSFGGTSSFGYSVRCIKD